VILQVNRRTVDGLDGFRRLVARNSAEEVTGPLKNRQESAAESCSFQVMMANLCDASRMLH
jgi:hypothetical protein